MFAAEKAIGKETQNALELAIVAPTTARAKVAKRVDCSQL